MNLILADKNIEQWQKLIESDSLISSLDDVKNDNYTNESYICKETASLDDIQLFANKNNKIKIIYFYSSPEYVLSKNLDADNSELALKKCSNYIEKIIATQRCYKEKISFVNYHYTLSDNQTLSNFLHYIGYKNFNIKEHKPIASLKLLIAKNIINSNDKLRDQCEILHAMSLPLSNNFNVQYDQDELLKLFKATDSPDDFYNLINISDLQPVHQELIRNYEILELSKLEVGRYKSDFELVQKRFSNQRWEMRKSKIISRALGDLTLYIAQILNSKWSLKRKLKDFIKIKYRLDQKKIIELYSIAESGYFDTAWYLEKYKDVKESGMPAIIHFYYYGASEGRSPSKRFDAMDYLNRYSDVRDSKINPLLHYINYGKNESRIIKRVGEKK